MTVRAKGPRIYPVCSRCTERHHHWAYCKDGVRASKGTAPVFKKGDPLRGAALAHQQKKEAEAAETVTAAPAETLTTETPTLTTAAVAREELRTLATTLPEGSQQRRSIELMIARDEAREGHAKDEADLQSRDPSARLPLPTILRDTSEEAGRHLNSEMDRLLFAAGSSARTQREILPKEAQVVHDTLAGLEEKRDREASAAREADRKPEHRPGEQPWFCTECGQRFRSGTMNEVREWARKDPTWKFRCPECNGIRVQIIEAA